MADNKTTVSVRYCTGYEAIGPALEALLGDLGGLGQFIRPGQKVLIKPNFIAPVPVETPAQTHPALVVALATLVKDLGAHPVIGDSPAWGNMDDCIKALGLNDTLKKLAIPYVSFRQSRRLKLTDAWINLCVEALEVDAIINVPKFKAHQQLGATFAIKNMYGCVVGKEKAVWHLLRGRSYNRFCRMLIEIYETLHPVVNIIDGVHAMQGPGPIRGTRYDLGCLIGGVHPMACEQICCNLIGLSSATLPIHQAWLKMGKIMPDNNGIELKGDSIAGFCRGDFQFPNQIPLYFSFPHVIRSISRQLYGRIKRGLWGKCPSQC